MTTNDGSKRGDRIPDARDLDGAVAQQASGDRRLLPDLVAQAHEPRPSSRRGTTVAAAIASVSDAPVNRARFGHGLVEPDDATREHAVDPGALGADIDLAPGEPVPARRHAQRRHRIAHDGNAARRAAGEAPHEPEHRRVDVQPVGDHPDRDPLVLEDGRGRPGFAVVERRHRVEQVRRVSRAGLDPAPHLLVAGVGVPDRDHDATGCQGLDHGQRARQLGGDGDDADPDSTDQPATASSEGSASDAWACAPARRGEMNGPSTCQPSGSAPA